MSDDPHLYPLIIALLLFSALFNFFIILCNTVFGNVNVRLIFERIAGQESAEDKHGQDLMKMTFRCNFTNRFLNAVLLGAGACLALLLPYPDIPSVGLYLLVMIILTEFVPRKIALAHSEGIVRKFAGFQRFLILLFYPFYLVLSIIGDIVLKIFRQETKVEIVRYSEDEVMSMLEAGQQSGEIKEEGKKMINSIFQFDDELAYEIMTPRTDVFMIDSRDPASAYIDQLMKLRFSRIPVYEGDQDNIIGILHIKDYLIKARNVGFDQVDIRSILRKPYFVPETKNIDSLFFELQKERQHIAILIDEYGGFSGIVTLEDIIEEVMGDIDDEYDVPEDLSIRKIDDNTYLVSGKEYLDDLNESIGTDLESENSETVGGFIIDLLGEIPGEEDKDRKITYRNYVFTILLVRERRIEALRLEILPVYEEEQEEPDEKQGK